MQPESLLASATINFGLAFVVLSLFSILKKQPSTAPLYYARRLSRHCRVPFDPPLTFRRFTPSVSWIPRAFRVTEDEIVDSSGLDALIVIRLFKFGIKFFVVCSLMGVVLLLPVNYNGQDGPPLSYNSLDAFTISNIRMGSDRLWVHFTCLCLISFYGLYLLYKEYYEILSRRIQRLQSIRDRPDQFTVLVRGIPQCPEHGAHSCSVDHFFSTHYPDSYCSYQMLYHGKDMEELLEQVKSTAKMIEDLRKKSVEKGHTEELLLEKKTREDFTKIASHEEKLQKLYHRIHQLQSESELKRKELAVAFVTFKSRQVASTVAQSQQHSHPLLWTTEMSPEPADVSWKNLAIPYKILPLNKIFVILAATLLTIFFAVPVTAVQGIARFEKLKKWFPPAMAIQLIPGLRSVVTGYLPSVVLNGFIYAVPFAMLGMARLSGSISKSKEELKACNMVFFFPVGNVFFLSLLSGSLLDEIGESVTHPKHFPGHLARAVSVQVFAFMDYRGIGRISAKQRLITGRFLHYVHIDRRAFRVFFGSTSTWISFVGYDKVTHIWPGKEKRPYLYSFPYFRVIPVVSLAVLIGMVYAVIAPLLLPFLICYFCLGYIVYVNQIQDVYETVYDTGGKYWTYVHHYIIVSIVLMQITMIGLFGLKSKPAASISTVPLILLSVMFDRYCKIRFYPTFRCYTVQNVRENDELDRKSEQLGGNYESAGSAYCPPFLQPMNLMRSESSSTQPLVRIL